MIDSQENGFDEDGINYIKQKLSEELSNNNFKIRKWFQEKGSENILRWLNETLEK